jgi:hypothetical protein
MRKKLLLLVTTAILSFVAFSQQKKPAIISGVVKDARTKSPLIEAVVTLKSNAFEGEKYSVTDSSGMYSINNLPSGTYTVTFEMEGYEKFSKDGIVVAPGMSLGVSFEMIKEQKRTKKALVKENN